MADFFSNLLARSGSGARPARAVLQPRLPGLFEARQGADEFPAPQVQGSLYESVHEPAAALRGQDATTAQAGVNRASVTSSTPAARFPTATGENQAPALPERPALKGIVAASTPEQLLSSAEPQQGMQGKAFGAEPAAETENVPARENVDRPGTGPVDARQATGRVLNSAALIAETLSSHELESLPPTLAQGTAFRAEPAIEMENAPARENGDSSRPGTGPVNARQATGQVLNGAVSLIAETSSSREVESPPSKIEHSAGAYDAQLPGPFLRPASLQLPHEPETVVQVHIGRIEVRAVTPPAAPPPTPAVRPQPKMSLDDYLRQREDKR